MGHQRLLHTFYNPKNCVNKALNKSSRRSNNWLDGGTKSKYRAYKRESDVFLNIFLSLFRLLLCVHLKLYRWSYNDDTIFSRFRRSSYARVFARNTGIRCCLPVYFLHTSKQRTKKLLSRTLSYCIEGADNKSFQFIKRRYRRSLKD